MKTLIVDDEIVFRETLRAMLEPYGTCHMVMDGALAVQAFNAALQAGEPFQLVLLDIQMPNMDGQEALLKMRQLERQAHHGALHEAERAIILMQTSMEDPVQLATAFKTGHCNGYLVKPVDQDDLLARLKKYRLI